MVPDTCAPILVIVRRDIFLLTHGSKVKARGMESRLLRMLMGSMMPLLWAAVAAVVVATEPFTAGSSNNIKRTCSIHRVSIPLEAWNTPRPRRRRQVTVLTCGRMGSSEDLRTLKPCITRGISGHLAPGLPGLSGRPGLLGLLDLEGWWCWEPHALDLKI